MQKEVEYLGHRITSEGIHPAAEKLRTIKEAPAPQNQLLQQVPPTLGFTFGATVYTTSERQGMVMGKFTSKCI